MCIVSANRRVMIRSSHILWTIVAFMICIICKCEAVVPVVESLQWVRIITTWYSKPGDLLYFPYVLCHVLFLHPHPCTICNIPSPQHPLVKLFLSKSGGGCVYWLTMVGITGSIPVDINCCGGGGTNWGWASGGGSNYVVWAVLHRWRIWLQSHLASVVCVCVFVTVVHLVLDSLKFLHYDA